MYNQIIFSFLFNFFDGWANVRFFGTCLIQLIYLLSFVYMMSQSGLRRDAQLLGAVLIMLPFCVSYGRLFLYHCFYIPKLAPGFLIIGVFFSFLKNDKSGRFPQIFRLIILSVLIFLNCALFVRQMVVSIFPVIGCLFFYLLAQSGSDGTPYRKWMLIPIIMALIGLAGFYFNSKIVIPALSLYGQSGQKLNLLHPQFWEPILQAFLYQFGFRSQVIIFSPVGILSIGGLFCAVVFIIWSVQNLVHAKKDFRLFILGAMMPVSMIINIFVFIFGEVPFRLQMDYSRYLAQASVWCVPLLCCRVHSREKFPSIRKFIYILCLTIFVLNSFYNGFSFLHPENFDQLYDGLAYTNPHLVKDLQSAIEYIKVHDYSYGYAFAGEANTMVEVMNGLPVVSLRRTPDRVLEYTNWLSVKSYKTIQSDRAFFLMTANDEIYYQDTLEEIGIEKVYFDDNGYVIYDVSNIDSFRKFIREPIVE